MFNSITSSGGLFILESLLPSFEVLFESFVSQKTDQISYSEKKSQVITILNKINNTNTYNSKTSSNKSATLREHTIEELMFNLRDELLLDLLSTSDKNSFLGEYLTLNSVFIYLRKFLRKQFLTSKKLDLSKVDLSSEEIIKAESSISIGKIESYFPTLQNTTYSSLSEIEKGLDTIYYNIIAELAERVSFTYKVFLKFEIEAKLVELYSRFEGKDLAWVTSYIDSIPQSLFETLEIDLYKDTIYSNTGSGFGNKVEDNISNYSAMNHELMSFLNSTLYIPDYELKSLQIYKKIIFFFYNLQIFLNSNSNEEMEKYLINYDYL